MLTTCVHSCTEYYVIHWPKTCTYSAQALTVSYEIINSKNQKLITRLYRVVISKLERCIVADYAVSKFFKWRLKLIEP